MKEVKKGGKKEGRQERSRLDERKKGKEERRNVGKKEGRKEGI